MGHDLAALGHYLNHLGHFLTRLGHFLAGLGLFRARLGPVLARLGGHQSWFFPIFRLKTHIHPFFLRKITRKVAQFAIPAQPNL